MQSTDTTTFEDPISLRALKKFNLTKLKLNLKYINLNICYFEIII